MAEPSNSAVLAICLKTSERSCMPSIVKLGECLLKYSFLVSLTRLVSWLNASEQLHVSTLYQGRISHCLELGALPRLPWMWSHQEACHPLGLGRGVISWAWGEHSGTGEEGATGADGCSIGGAPCDKVNGWDVGACSTNM